MNYSISPNEVMAAFRSEQMSKGLLRRMLKRIPRTDADPSWIKASMDQGKIPEEDLLVFSSFQNTDETILDVGSNWGYSAIGIWNVGSKCRIISFDPIVGFDDCLNQIKNLKGEQFDYRITALSDEVGETTLYVPVIRDQMLTALATAQSNPDFDIYAKNIDAYNLTADAKSARFRFYSFRSKTERLDDLLNRDFPRRKIVAVKMDAEGYEPKILRGMLNTLRFHKPLLLIENGALKLTQNILSSEGYLLAERIGGNLQIAQNKPNAINFFYCHSDNINEYKQSGIVV